MPLFNTSNDDSIPLHILDAEGVTSWLDDASASDASWVTANGFTAALGQVVCLPGADGGIGRVLAGWGTAAARSRDRFHLAAIAAALPMAQYVLQPGPIGADLEVECLGWLLGGYRFSRYREDARPVPNLVCPQCVRTERLGKLAEAAFLTQDLINTPARDMGPSALERAFLALAEEFSATANVIRGIDALESANFPMIAAVGAAAADAPRLLDMTWGRADAPKVTIVGKGVCFDTGGLNIKPGASMGLMKKDMGGAANALGLARMVMSLGLDIRLRVLVPAVENAISGPAMRPGDILTSRKGLTVEINNTDAEGRLVLADALALADEESPELLFSLATLTGAARVALGPDVPPFFTDDESLAADLGTSSVAVADPLWRLPFWTPYEPLIEPGIADLDNAPSGGMAGAVTAALFLRRFVENCPAYCHIDMYGWTPTAKPGRPKGGACHAVRAIFDVLESRY